MSILDKIASWLDRRELQLLRKEIASFKEEAERMKPRLSYLEARDAMCSRMANTINSQAFEIAKLRGEYEKSAPLNQKEE